MAQDASVGGTPDNIHDGLDNIYWTGSSIIGGKFTFDSTDQANTGLQSVKTDDAKVNDIMQFYKGSSVDLSNYVSISLNVYVDKDWKANDSIEIFGWDTATLSRIGIGVNLEDNFAWGVFKIWHKVIIPLDTFELESSTIDTFRIKILQKEGKSPKFYIDDFRLEQTGNNITYTLEPDKGSWRHIDSIQTTFVDAYNPALADVSIKNLSYNKILGLTLGSGYLVQFISEGIVKESHTVKNISNLLQNPNTKISDNISDGTNTLLTICQELKTPFVLKSEYKDKMLVTIQEDYSQLIEFRIGSSGYDEER